MTSNPIRRLLGCSGGGDGEAGVALERLDPAAEIGRRVLDRRGADARMGAQEGRRHFGDEFLLAVVGCAEGSEFGVEPAAQPLAVAGGVGEFVEQRRVVGLGGRKARRLGELHRVDERLVEGP